MVAARKVQRFNQMLCEVHDCVVRFSITQECGKSQDPI
jgi:hypothetical protein